MSSGRPMSEHDGALFDAVQAIAATVLDMGGDAGKLREKLEAARATSDARGNRHGVETLDFLIASLFKAPTPPAAPTAPAEPKSPFRVV